MAYCIHCGSQNKPTANFCGKCGKSTKAEVANIKSTPQAPVPHGLEASIEDEPETSFDGFQGEAYIEGADQIKSKGLKIKDIMAGDWSGYGEGRKSEFDGKGAVDILRSAMATTKAEDLD